MLQHVLLKSFCNPYKCTTKLLYHRVFGLIICELFTQIINLSHFFQTHQVARVHINHIAIWLLLDIESMVY